VLEEGEEGVGKVGLDFGEAQAAGAAEEVDEMGEEEESKGVFEEGVGDFEGGCGCVGGGGGSANDGGAKEDSDIGM
jgi:hypothetical protein